MVVLAILAVAASLVGAAVVLSSNVATQSGTVIADNHGAIVITLGNTGAVGTYYSTDTAGINYDMSAYMPVALKSVTVTVTITEKTAQTGPSWSDIGHVQIVSAQLGAPVNMDQSSYTAFVSGSTFASLTYTATIAGAIPAGSLSGDLNIVYNIPGTFDVSASMTGSTV